MSLRYLLDVLMPRTEPPAELNLDRLAWELGKLRSEGLWPAIREGLVPVLARLASLQATDRNPTAAEQIENGTADQRHRQVGKQVKAIIETVAEQLDGGRNEATAELFGLGLTADEEMPYVDLRREAAAEKLHYAVSTFQKYHEWSLIKSLATLLLERYGKDLAVAETDSLIPGEPDEYVPAEPSGIESDVLDEPPGFNDNDDATESNTLSTRVSSSVALIRTLRLAILGVAFVSSVMILVLIRLLLPSNPRLLIPPQGFIVNTWTGRASSHMPTGKVSGYGGAQIEGGPDLRACDISAGLPCAYLRKSTSISARIGDIIEFKQRLYDPSDVPIPYLKLSVDWGPGSKHEGEELGVQMLIQWPTYPNGVAYPAGSGGDFVTIHLATSGAYHLTYIPKSTTLTSSFNPHLSYHLPDGIMSGGIGLEDVGSPKSCFECADEYERIVNFQAKIT